MMNLWVSFINVFLLFAIVFIIIKINRRKSPLGNISVKIKKILCYVFVAMLILSVPVLYILPKNNFIKDSNFKNDNMKFFSIEDIKILYNGGNLYNEPLLQKQNSYKISVQNKDFSINERSNSFVEIVPEKKKVDDGIIDVDVFTYKNSSQLTKPNLGIRMDKDKLEIYNSSSGPMEYYKFINNFTISRFIGDDSKNYDYIFPSTPTIVFIRFPSNVNLLNGNKYK